MGYRLPMITHAIYRDPFIAGSAQKGASPQIESPSSYRGSVVLSVVTHGGDCMSTGVFDRHRRTVLEMRACTQEGYKRSISVGKHRRGIGVEIRSYSYVAMLGSCEPATTVGMALKGTPRARAEKR